MKKIFLPLLFCIAWDLAISQQSSVIRVRSSKNTEISVTQSGNDTLQKTDIDFDKSIGTNVRVDQRGKVNTNTAASKSQEPEKPEKGFMYYVTNIKTVVSTIAGILALVTWAWRYKVARKSAPEEPA